MATQKDVAKLAGVSFITVSRVVNNEGNVKDETRKRVEAAIRELGYFPSFAGKALNSGRNRTIGVMTPASFGEGMESAYLMSVLRGIEAECRARDEDILLSPLGENDPGFDYLRPYRQRKVDGMIYVGLRSISDSMAAEMEECMLPCVVIGDRPAHPRISWIDTDNETAAYETTKKIWARGHRRIFFHGLDKGLRNANIADRERGYRRAIAELSGKSAEESWIIRADYDMAEIRRTIRDMMEGGGPKPTAIFCATDNRALGALRELDCMGLSVPDDVSLVGFDGFLKDCLLHPSMATNGQPLFEMGKRAAEILFENIETGTAARREELFPVAFIEGESLGTA